MSNQDIPNLTKYWRPYKHQRAFVYKPYYNNAYTYWDEPYFISEYISKYDQIYDPTLCNQPEKIKLEDGTVIEAFSGKVISRGKPIPNFKKSHPSMKIDRPITTLTRPDIPEPETSRPQLPPPSKPQEVKPVISSVKPSIPSKKTYPRPVSSKKSRKGRKKSRPGKIKLPKPTDEPSAKDEPPVDLPSHVPKSKWRKWWRINKHHYGDRNYYYNLGYPVWWLDFYYPEFDDYYYYNDIWDDVGLYPSDNLYREMITYDSDDDFDTTESEKEKETKTTIPSKDLMDQLMIPQFMMMGMIFFLMIFIIILVSRKNI